MNECSFNDAETKYETVRRGCGCWAYLLTYLLVLSMRVQILQKYRLKSHNSEMGMIHMPFTVPDRPVLVEFIPRLAEADAGRPPRHVL